MVCKRDLNEDLSPI